MSRRPKRSKFGSCSAWRRDFSFAVVCDILERRCEGCENQRWTGDVVQQLANMSTPASNCCTTWLLRNKISNLFENRQTVAQTVQPRHTGSNSLRKIPCCANCLTVCGGPFTLRDSEGGGKHSLAFVGFVSKSKAEWWRLYTAFG